MTTLAETGVCFDGRGIHCRRCSLARSPDGIARRAFLSAQREVNAWQTRRRTPSRRQGGSGRQRSRRRRRDGFCPQPPPDAPTAATAATRYGMTMTPYLSERASGSVGPPPSDLPTPRRGENSGCEGVANSANVRDTKSLNAAMDQIFKG